MTSDQVLNAVQQVFPMARSIPVFQYTDGVVENWTAQVLGRTMWASVYSGGGFANVVLQWNDSQRQPHAARLEVLNSAG